MYSD
jgi:hypothetical protein